MLLTLLAFPSEVFVVSHLASSDLCPRCLQFGSQFAGNLDFFIAQYLGHEFRDIALHLFGLLLCQLKSMAQFLYHRLTSSKVCFVLSHSISQLQQLAQSVRANGESATV